MMIQTINDFADQAVSFTLLNHTILNNHLRSKGRKIGRYGLVSHVGRDFLVRPAMNLPIKDLELGKYLERKYAVFHLEVYDSGAVSFSLGGNDPLKPILDSVAWAYSKFIFINCKETNPNAKKADKD